MLNPLTALNPYMFWIKIAGVVLVLAGVAGATHYVDANVYGKQISDLKLAQSKTETANVSASLAQLQTFIGKMNAADTDYQSKLDAIKAQFLTIQQELAHALRTPLPDNCKPTADRVRSFHDALDAANAGAPAVK